MKIVNIHEAKTHLWRLLERVARVISVDAPASDGQRRLGFLQGEIKVPDDFDRMGEEAIIGMFERGPEDPKHRSHSWQNS